MARRRLKRDEQRERRIAEEIVVDAHDADEQAMGWYCQLENQLRFPFGTTCIAKRATSPLRVKDEVEVIGRPGEDECAQEMFVTIRWEKGGLAVPLSQLRPTRSTDAQTREAIEDWHYRIDMDYAF